MEVYAVVGHDTSSPGFCELIGACILFVLRLTNPQMHLTSSFV